MSKELTEQWRNGTLPLGAYYVNYQYNNRVWLYRDKSQTPENTIGLFEILAPVPTYDQFVELTEKVNQFSQLVKKVEKLEKRLEIATKALERIEDLASDNDGINDGGIIWCALNALKEMKKEGK